MKKIIFNYHIYLICLLSLLILISCEKGEKNKDLSILKKTLENSLGKKLNIPVDLKLYSPFSRSVSDSTKIANSDLKLYTHINTSCSTCVDEIETWINFINKLKQYNVSVILICSSKDNFEFFKYLCEKKDIKNFSQPFFLDIKNDYVSKNLFMKTTREFETVLTNAENKILLIGNPIHSKETKSIFLNEIPKLMKEDREGK